MQFYREWQDGLHNTTFALRLFSQRESDDVVQKKNLK